VTQNSKCCMTSKLSTVKWNINVKKSSIIITIKRNAVWSMLTTYEFTKSRIFWQLVDWHRHWTCSWCCKICRRLWHHVYAHLDTGCADCCRCSTLMLLYKNILFSVFDLLPWFPELFPARLHLQNWTFGTCSRSLYCRPDAHPIIQSSVLKH